MTDRDQFWDALKEHKKAKFDAADTVEIAKLNAMLDEQRGEIERLKAELAVTNIEAARYRWLRDSMRFDSDPHGKHTMVFPYKLAAPWHDFHKDWISERFTASVDKTVDAAIEQEQSE